MSNNLFKDEAVMASVLIKIVAIERLLIEKKVITKDELDKMTNNITIMLARSVLNDAGIDDVDNVVKEFSEKIK